MGPKRIRSESSSSDLSAVPDEVDVQPRAALAEPKQSGSLRIKIRRKGKAKAPDPKEVASRGDAETTGAGIQPEATLAEASSASRMTRRAPPNGSTLAPPAISGNGLNEEDQRTFDALRPDASHVTSASRHAVEEGQAVDASPTYAARRSAQVRLDQAEPVAKLTLPPKAGAIGLAEHHQSVDAVTQLSGARPKKKIKVPATAPGAPTTPRSTTGLSPALVGKATLTATSQDTTSTRRVDKTAEIHTHDIQTWRSLFKKDHPSQGSGNLNDAGRNTGGTTSFKPYVSQGSSLAARQKEQQEALLEQERAAATPGKDFLLQGKEMMIFEREYRSELSAFVTQAPPTGAQFVFCGISQHSNDAAASIQVVHPASPSAGPFHRNSAHFLYQTSLRPASRIGHLAVPKPAVYGSSFYVRPAYHSLAHIGEVGR